MLSCKHPYKDTKLWLILFQNFFFVNGHDE